MKTAEKIYYDLINLPDLALAYIFWSKDTVKGLFFKIARGEKLTDFINEIQSCYKDQEISAGDGSLWSKKLLSKQAKIKLSGSNLEIKVWKVLQKIPRGTVWNYTQVARVAGFPKAVRAVASAIGRNHLSLLIPCHRVVRLDGSLGGYRFGLKLKEKILKSESTQFKK